MTTTYTLTGDFTDLLGVDIPGSKIFATLGTNLGEVALVDLDNNKVHPPRPARLAVSDDGTFSATLIATDSTGINVTGGTLRYIVRAEISDGRQGKISWDSGYFTLTANSDLVDKVGSDYVAPDVASGALAEIQTLVERAEAASPSLESWPTFVYGNSYGDRAAGWFTIGNHYTDQVASLLDGGAVTSYAVGGRRIIDVCATLINGTALPGTASIIPAGEWPGTSSRSGLVVLECTINDIAHYATMLAPVPAAITTANTRYLDGLRGMYRTALAIMSAQSRISQAAATRNGTWDVVDIPTGSASGDSLSYTSSAGAGLTYSVTPPQTGPLAGKVYFLSYTLDPAIGANPVSTVQITVDALTPTTFTMPVWEQYVGHDGVNTYQAPVMIPVDVPIDGAAHTVKFAHAGAGGTFFYADDLFVPSADPNPIAVMGAEHPLTGFVGSALAAYDGNRKKVGDVVKAVTAEFGNAFYVPSTMTATGLYSGDGLHPNDRGMTQRAGDLANAVRLIKPRLDSRHQAARPDSAFPII